MSGFPAVANPVPKWNVVQQPGPTCSVNSWDCVVSTAGSGSLVATMPPSPLVGDMVAFTRIPSAIGHISILPNTGQTIMGKDNTYTGQASAWIEWTNGDSSLPNTIGTGGATFVYIGGGTWMPLGVVGGDLNNGSTFKSQIGDDAYNTSNLNFQVALNSIVMNVPILLAAAFAPKITKNLTSLGYTVKTTDCVVVNPGTAAKTCTLSADTAPIVSTGYGWFFLNQSTGTITISAHSGNIDGLSTKVIGPYSYAFVTWDGTNYWTAFQSGTQYSPNAIASAPTLGAAAVVSASSNTTVHILVTASGTLTITYGPSTGTENTICSGIAAVAGSLYTVKIPATWLIAVSTGTTATWTAQAVAA